MAKQSKIEQIVIPPIAMQTVTFRVVGDSSYCSGNWSAQAIEDMSDKGEGKAVPKKKIRDKNREYCDSLYWLDKFGNPIHYKTDPEKHQFFGIPTIAFKKAMIKAANDVGLQQTFITRAVQIDEKSYCVIQKSKPRLQVDIARANGKSAIICYRPYFDKWETSVKVSYNSNLISADMLANLLNTAGFGVGVGVWRPEKSGNNGRFHVE